MLEMINVSYAYKSKKEIVHVLDKENRRKIVELLQQIAHEQDRCVIVVTHSDYVKKKCDICYEMGDDDEE